MREITQVKFREKESGVAWDLEGAHFLTWDRDDLDINGGVLGTDGFSNILSEGGVCGFVMSSAPLVLFAIGADLDGNGKLMFIHSIFDIFM